MIDVDFTDLDKLRNQFDPKIIDRALNSAINKTTKKASTYVSKKVREKYNVKAARIKGAVKQLRRPKTKDLIAERVLLYTGRKIPLVNFGARKARVKGSKHKGVSVLVKKSGGRKTVKGDTGYGAFLAESPSDELKVYIRQRKDRLPIRALYGPSVAEMVSDIEIFDQVDDFVKAEMPKQLEHELEFFLTKAGAL